MAVGLGMDPIFMTIAVTLAVCAAYMLPVATPSNAVAFGSGEVSIKQMVRAAAVPRARRGVSLRKTPSRPASGRNEAQDRPQNGASRDSSDSERRSAGQLERRTPLYRTARPGACSSPLSALAVTGSSRAAPRTLAS